MDSGSRSPRRFGLPATLGSATLIAASLLLGLSSTDVGAAGNASASPGASGPRHHVSVDVDTATSIRPEPGGAFRFDVTIRNSSDWTVTLVALTDALGGDLDGVGTCSTGVDVAPDDDYRCAFERTFTGNAGDRRTEVVSATLRDADGDTVTRRGRATIGLSDVAPTIEVTKTADRIHVPPGSKVRFTVRIRNTSVEPVTLTALVDVPHGDLDGAGTCATGGSIDPGATYTCRFTVIIDRTETDVVTATVADDDGGSVSGIAEATVGAHSLTVDKRNDAPITALVLPDGSTADLPTAHEGATVRYTIAYTFSGDPLTNGVITDVLPFGLQYVKGSATGDRSFRFADFESSNGTLSWKAEAIASSGSVSYSAFVLEGASTLSQPLENVAAILSDQTDPTDDDSDIFVPAAVSGETGRPKPRPTIPPTDTLGPEAAVSGAGVTLVVVVLIGLMAGIGRVASAPPRRRRRR